jgi:hypothetical protein
VSINAKGDIVAIGAQFDDNSGSNSGSTKIYQKGLRGNVTIEDDLSVGGDLIVNGGIYTDNFSVADTTGHTTIGGDLQLGSIPNVEQKIIDLSNATIPYITYDWVGDKLVVTKDMDLGLNGNINCTEIKVNSIPLNSFFNFTYGYNYTPNSHNFGKGRHIVVDSSTLNETYSHFVTFDRTNENFTCKAQYLGTYEIQAHVTYRNTAGGRHNPCIAIGVNDDVVNGTIGSTGTSPNWLTKLTNSYSQHNIFSAQYVRMSEGKVTTLSCTRIYHFNNTTDEISINTFMEIAGGNDFGEEAGAYHIMNAGISFKYIGNFDNIT